MDPAALGIHRDLVDRAVEYAVLLDIMDKSTDKCIYRVKFMYRVLVCFIMHALSC